MDNFPTPDSPPWLLLWQKVDREPNWEVWDVLGEGHRDLQKVEQARRASHDARKRSKYANFERAQALWKFVYRTLQEYDSTKNYTSARIREAALLDLEDARRKWTEFDREQDAHPDKNFADYIERMQNEQRGRWTVG